MFTAFSDLTDGLKKTSMSSMLRSGQGGGGYRRALAVAAVVGSVGLALYLGFKKLRASKAKGNTAAEKLKGGKKRGEEAKSLSEVKKTEAKSPSEVKKTEAKSPSEVKKTEEVKDTVPKEAETSQRSSSSADVEKVEELKKDDDRHSTTPPILSPSVPTVTEPAHKPSPKPDIQKAEEATEEKMAEPFEVTLASMKETVKEDTDTEQTDAPSKFETKMDNDVVVIQESVKEPDVDPSESILSIDSSITTLDMESMDATDIPSIEITSETPPHVHHSNRTALSSLGDDIEIIADGGSVDLDLSQSGDFVKVKHSEQDAPEDDAVVSVPEGTGNNDKAESEKGDSKEITTETTSSKEEEGQAGVVTRDEDGHAKENLASEDEADLSTQSSPGRGVNDPTGTV